MKIAVAGGTGLAGRLVVEALRARGHAPVVLSRGQGVDLLSGAGLDAALAGAEAVVDVSNVTTTRGSVSVDFFDRAGRHLVGAAARAGVRHLVTLSIVGVDRVRNPYYAGKLRQEEIVRGGAVPWTVLRATQFHEFAGQLLGRRPRADRGGAGGAGAARRRTGSGRCPRRHRAWAAAGDGSRTGRPAGGVAGRHGPAPHRRGRRPPAPGPAPVRPRRDEQWRPAPDRHRPPRHPDVRGLAR